MGIGTSREGERAAAAFGQLEEASPIFKPNDNVCHAGVLFFLPALMAHGLLNGEAIYGKLKNGYYGLVTILLFISFLALARIKNPEQIKNCKVGEFGKLLGLDRCPEVKCLRRKLGEIVEQKKARQFNDELFCQWLDEQKWEAGFYFYIDGHVRVYHGNQATLPKRFVSRQKLCLAGTSEYWVNSQIGMPYLVVTGHLNEKLKVVIKEQIIPLLLAECQNRVNEDAINKDEHLPRFSIVFDREAYEPAFFKWLWDKHRIAVISYRKNITNQWSSDEFSEYPSAVIGKTVTMKLAEQSVELAGMKMREIRKESDNGHQTSIITTNYKLPLQQVGGRMFSRWSQENFFRYMVQDYGLDRMIEYGTEPVEPDRMVVNPSYAKLANELAKLREKQNRLKAKFYKILDENLDNDLDTMKKRVHEQAELQETIQGYQHQIDETLEKRKKIQQHVKVEDMPDETRYNKLKTESKLFINTIKMIAYRAETAVVNLLTPYYTNNEKDGRMLAKQIIESDADLIPDYHNNTLTVRLHSLSSPRANRAAMKLCQLLNDTETRFPNTNLTLHYETV
jgi:hypothetical protein